MNQEYRSVCRPEYKSKSDHLKSVKHLEKLNQFFCKKCNSYMFLSDNISNLGSDEHKQPNHASDENQNLFTANLIINKATTYFNYKRCPKKIKIRK